MERLSIILGLICLSVLNTNAQNDPLTLAKAIFARQEFADLNKHVTGEYTGRPNGTDLAKNATTIFELLDQNDKIAVVALTIVDSTGKAFDAYLHFVNDKVWKITALRALAVTGIIEELIKGYEKMSQSQRDSMEVLQERFMNLQGDSIKPKSMDWTVKNAKLILSSDKDLIDHFRINKEKFEAIKNGLLGRGIFQSTKSLDELDDSKMFRQQLDNLLIDNVGRSSLGYDENLEFTIGGMIDNTVGYLYVKDKKNKPSMSPNGFIMIREIGNGWYLFKTT